MTDLFLSPHNDDETLFGAYTIIREKPHVVICLRSHKQKRLFDVDHSVREAETAQALWNLGPVSWEQLTPLDTFVQDLEGILEDEFRRLDGRYAPERVWAPAVEDGGHEQHNLVGQLAYDIWGVKVRPYLTYRRGHMRTRGKEVVATPSMIARKLRALSCYESQFGVANTQPWFMDDTLREYAP